MSEIVLDLDGMHFFAREIVAAAVSEHVRMAREGKPRPLTRPFHDRPDPIAIQTMTLFTVENEWARIVQFLHSVQCPNFIALDRVMATDAALLSPYIKEASGKIDIRPTKIASLTYP